MTRWILAWTFGVVVGWLPIQMPVWACSCAQPSSAQDGLANSDAVFLGQVRRFEVKGSKRVATFRVQTVWKGPEVQQLRVSTGMSDGDCGFHFIAGLDYVVYARQEGRRDFSTNICTRTIATWHGGHQEAKMLGAGTTVSRE